MPVLCLFGTAQAQLFDAHNYQPIKIRGRVPLDFLARAQGNVVIDLPPLAIKNANAYGFNSSILLRQKFLEANIYYNDTLSGYVKRVLNTLLYNNQSLRRRISPFVTRSTTPNATTWQDGTILLNVGLLSRLENEAQLAFVLAHEITHYLKQDGYEIFELATQQQTGLDDPLQIVARSDAHEVNADKAALQLLRAAGYDYREGVRTLEVIEYDPTHHLNIVQILSTPEVKIEEKELCQPINIEQNYKQHHIFTFRDGRRPIDIISRIRLLRAEYSLTDSVGERFCSPQGTFDTIRQIANLEMIENSYQRFDYIRSAHAALVRLQDDPTNIYCATRAAQSLYGIASYAKYGNLSNILFDKGLLRETDLAKFYCFIDSQKPNYLQQFLYRSVEKLYNIQPNDSQMIIAMAQATELYLGLDIAQKFYSKYIGLYPQGENISLAQLKTKH